MPRGTSGGRRALSRRLYRLLLAAYPSEFRQRFGREMAVVFHDRCRDAGRAPAALARLWAEALTDFVRTAPAEHLRAFEGGAVVRVLKTALTALAVYAFALLVAAPFYVRNREAMPGFVNSLFDALIATGVLFNLVYLVLTLPRLVGRARAVRLAAALTAPVVAGLLAVIVLRGGLDARPSPLVYVAQAVGFLFWFAAHAWWVHRRPDETGPPAPA